ncbi:MAG: leucine-rich repeat domain-containing protein, partial [Peptococcaceae bacterium]|nr:leucine-rich repeat domain-containing protein [Peptococcaceae bacterium]
MTTPAFAVEADNQTNVEEQEEEYRIFVKVGENNLFFFISSQPTDGQPGTVSVQQPIVDESGKFPDIAPYKGSVIIPDTIEYEGKQYTVTKIGGAAFYGSEVTEVSIPDTVTEIGGEAFMSCGNLSSVTFRDNSALESIGVNAFSGCQKLTSLNLPDSLIKIGDRAFAYCVNLNELDIPDNVTEIGSTAFGNTGIEKLVIPAGVTNGVVAALQSYDPARVSFAEGSPYKIDDGIVYSGTVLEGALDKDITEVTVLDGTTAIAENAFDSCASLEKVVFPDSLKEIRYQAFSQCTSLAEADLPSALTTIGQEAFTKTKLSRVVIPEGVTEIPRGAFSNVSSLKTVVIPGTVTDIGENAFSGITGDASGKNFIMQNATATTFNEYAFGSTGNGKKKKPVVPDQLTVIIPEGSEDSYTVENYILKKYLTDESGAIKKGVTYGLSLKDTSMALKAAEATTGGSLTLKAAIPIDAEVDCKSDNSEAATVEYKDGKIVVTGVSKGAATISVKLSLDGVTLVEDSCTVTVTDEGVVVPDVKESVTNTDAITDANDKAIAASAATSVTAQDTLREAANEEAAKITDSEQQQLLAKAEEQGLTGDNVKLYTQTYLDIEAKAVEKNESTGDVTSITLDITPKMQVVASTATNSADIKIDGTDKNAVVVKTAEPLTISGDSEITVKLPSNFAEKLVYIKHGAKNGTYFYKSTADKNGTLTFTSTHGFSPFTFSLTNEAVAEVGDTGYATLEAALDAAKDGDTVTVLKDKLTATMSGDSRTVTLKNGTGDEITVTINGKDYTIAAGETVDVTYSQPSTGPAVYAIAVDKADHGTVAVNPTKAAKGKTVTITATPDAGYAVDAVSVTDRKGKAVKVTA